MHAHAPCSNAGHTEVTDVLLWGEQRGAQCKNVQPDKTHEVSGLLATTDILRNSVIVSLPRSLALSVRTGQPCSISHLVPATVWSRTNKYVLPSLAGCCPDICLENQVLHLY